MAKIQIPGRSALPPSRTGAVKPSPQLAEGAGLAQAGRSVANIATSVSQDLIAKKAANEHAVFFGEVTTAIQGFSTHVAANPGASFDELNIEREKMMSSIEKAGQSSTTSVARRKNENWLAQKKGSIYGRTLESMERIKANQELATSEELIKGFVNNLDREGLEDHYQNQVAAGLYNKDVAQARFDNQIAVIDAAEKKLALKGISGIGFTAWQNTITPDNPNGDLNAGFDAIDALDISSSDKQAAESELKTRVTNRRAEANIELEAQREQDYDGISKLIYDDKNYEQAAAAVEASSLDEKTQASMRADIVRRATASANGTKLINDRVKEQELYEMGLDIWRNAVSKPEFDAALVVDQHRLDDEAYRRVAKNAGCVSSL